ncbi:MAG: SCP-like extracellular [Acidobacteria bacterium]|nr:SCP-like extracellular [Acidobacteriota bacterium]
MRLTPSFPTSFLLLSLMSLPIRSAPTESIARPILAAHNAIRARVGVPPLEWSTQLESLAREWSRSLASNGQFRHRPSGKYGENLFEIQGDRATPQFVVGNWASEAKDYNLSSNTCRRGAQCGHYTQVVWRNTTQVGCAVARRGQREVWVCYYNPPGNWVGEKPY